jgi:hypothetical protein
MKFKQGDRVNLVKPFNCQGDSVGTGARIDEELRRDLPPGALPAGEVTDPGTKPTSYVQVRWEKADGSFAWYVCDADVIEVENPVTPDEEEATIASILQSLRP